MIAGSDRSPCGDPPKAGGLDRIYCAAYSMWRIVLMPVTPLESLRQELRRGCLVMAVLAQLRVEHYGYTLRKALADRGLDIEEGTLYPLLRRLEDQGLLVSEWREEENRNKRFYRLSPDGRAVLKALLSEWQQINLAVERIAGRSRAVA